MTHSRNALSWAPEARRAKFAAMMKPRRAPVTPRTLRTLRTAELAAATGGKVLDNPAYEVAHHDPIASACTNPLY